MQLRPRIIPTLLLSKNTLVKTINFKDPSYIGDPINTLRIFNELEADELILLDIRASIEGRVPNFDLLDKISKECFMPLAYGGGLKNIEEVRKIFKIGFEKIIINSSSYTNPSLIKQIAEEFGSQSLIIAIDYKKDFLRRNKTYYLSGTEKIGQDVLDWCLEMESLGAGEIMLTCIDAEGTWNGLPLDFISEIDNKINIPLIAHGGTAKAEDIEDLFSNSKVSAVALGNMVIYQKEGMGVLVNMPNREKIDKDYLKRLDSSA